MYLQITNLKCPKCNYTISNYYSNNMFHCECGKIYFKMIGNYDYITHYSIEINNTMFVSYNSPDYKPFSVLFHNPYYQKRHYLDIFSHYESIIQSIPYFIPPIIHNNILQIQQIIDKLDKFYTLS